MMTAGSRGVWQAINNKAAEDVLSCPGSFALLFTQKQLDLSPRLQAALPSGARDTGLYLVAGGEIRPVENLPRLLPYQAIADFGVTRGGITSLEFVGVQTPLLIVQEENHWLSIQQQGNLAGEDLAYTSSLLGFQQDPTAIIQAYLTSAYQARHEKMIDRMGYVRVGVTEEWVRYVLRRHTNIDPLTFEA